jgi:hypothetical protein
LNTASLREFRRKKNAGMRKSQLERKVLAENVGKMRELTKPPVFP